MAGVDFHASNSRFSRVKEERALICGKTWSVLDDLLLLPIDAARQNDEVELPRLEYQTHDRSIW
jgi:hypothetical protein